MLLPETQQLCLSDISPSPSDRPQGPTSVETSGLPAYSPGLYVENTDTASMITDGIATFVHEDEYTMIGESYVETGSRQWYSPQAASPPWYYKPAQVAENDGLTSRMRGSVALNHSLFDHSQPSIFQNLPDGETYNTDGNSSPNIPALGPPIELSRPKYEIDVGDSVSHETMSDYATSGRSFNGNLVAQRPDEKFLSIDENDTASIRTLGSIVRNRNRKVKHNHSRDWYANLPHTKVPAGKPQECHECEYKCNRPEHLRRHVQSKHCVEFDGGPEMLPCVFPGCKDRKTGKCREIQARHDNLKAHYTKTHFKYGSTEKGGKNARKSMKAAHEMGLSVYDHRWTLLLQEKMNVNQEIKDFLHVWKMLGYSILETRDTKIIDVKPDWPGPEDATLQKYDPRWRALWDRTLTFDKAINRGHNMEETEAQGLLGVTMLETEAMGIRDLDPRWTMLLNRRMSVEQSEKLGVKHRNPVWQDLAARRRTRL